MPAPCVRCTGCGDLLSPTLTSLDCVNCAAIAMAMTAFPDETTAPNRQDMQSHPYYLAALSMLAEDVEYWARLRAFLAGMP
jgi:hypothetical protein